MIIWENLPKGMQISEVREYYDLLCKKSFSLKIKRFMDIICASLLLIILALPMLMIATMIVLDSPGGVFYRQERVTQYCKIFRIHKFRTMVANAEQLGTAVTVDGDCRVTKIGAILRKYRLDELPQLFDVLSGDMSFVGTRPEAVKYVKKYTPEMRATLLLPAGITSEASILYKNEAELLSNAEDVDRIYLEKILPEKMKYNLNALKRFSLKNDIYIMLKTVTTVIKD